MWIFRSGTLHKREEGLRTHIRVLGSSPENPEQPEDADGHAAIENALRNLEEAKYITASKTDDDKYWWS